MYLWLLKLLLKKLPQEYVCIPVKASPRLLRSMALRMDHAFGASDGMTDEEIEKLKKENPIMGQQYLTSREKELILTDMRRCHEEIVGKGFFKYEN
jgi:hypothetical protein